MKALPILALMLLLITYRQSKQKISTIIQPSVKSNTNDIAIADQDIINVCAYPHLMFMFRGLYAVNILGVVKISAGRKQSSKSYLEKTTTHHLINNQNQ